MAKIAKPYVEIYVQYKALPPPGVKTELAPALVGPLYRMYSEQLKASWYGQEDIVHIISLQGAEQISDIDGEYTVKNCKLVTGINSEIALPYTYATFDANQVSYSASTGILTISNVTVYPEYVSVNDVVQFNTSIAPNWYRITDIEFDANTNTLELTLENGPAVNISGVSVSLGLYYPFYDSADGSVTFYKRARSAWDTSQMSPAPTLTAGAGTVTISIASANKDLFDVWVNDTVEITYNTTNTTSGIVVKAVDDGANYTITISAPDITGTETINKVVFTPSGSLNQPSGSLILNSRIRQTTFASLPLVVDNDEEFYTTYGDATLDNPVAQAVALIRGSYDGPIYVYPTPSDDTSGYSSVLDDLTKERDSYGVVPLTSDSNIINTVKGYIESANAPDKNYIKVLVANYEIDQYVRIDFRDFSTVTPKPSYSNSNTTITNISFSETILPGDVIKVTETSETVALPVYLTVESVSGTTVTVKEKLGSDLTIVKAELVRSVYSAPNNLKSEIISYCESFGSVHAAVLVGHVYTEDENGNLIELPLYQAAASYGGMIAGFPPQVHFNLKRIPGVVYSDRLWDIFTEDDLSDIAGAGATLIVQDGKSDIPYIRNSLTTDMTSVLTRNLSITKMVDYVKRVLWNDLNTILKTGYNLVGDLESTIHILLQSRFDEWKKFVVPRYGPLILNGALTSLTLDEVNETAEVVITLVFPKPLGRIRLTLKVT